MSAFITSGGALLEVGCPSTLTRNTAQQVGFTSTLGGKRKGFIRKGGRRSWSVDVSVARPSEVSALEAVARGVGPYGWYPPEAVIGNLLSPQASGFDPTPASATDTGLVHLPDGSLARSIAHTSTSPVSVGATHGGFEAVPVRGDMTVGVWAADGVALSGQWLDQSLSALDDWAAPAASFTGWQWTEHTLTPPMGAAYLSLTLDQGARYARPSVSWGVTARDEGGTGCPVAVVHSPSYSPIALWEGANFTDISYSVTEVG